MGRIHSDNKDKLCIAFWNVPQWPPTLLLRHSACVCCSNDMTLMVREGRHLALPTCAMSQTSCSGNSSGLERGLASKQLLRKTAEFTYYPYIQSKSRTEPSTPGTLILGLQTKAAWPNSDL